MLQEILEEKARNQHRDNQGNKWAKMNDALHKSLFLYLPLTGLAVVGTDLGTTALADMLYNNPLYHVTMPKPLDAGLSTALILLSAPIAVNCGLNVVREFKKGIKYRNEYNKLEEAK